MDGAFSFYDNVNFYGYYARTRTRGLELEPGAQGNEQSYQAAFSYAGDLYGLQAEHLVVGDAFNPEVGFVRRDDFLRNYVLARYSPRPAMEAVRQFTWEGSYDYFENGAGVPETRIAQGTFGTEFENSDRVSANFERRYELGAADVRRRRRRPGPGRRVRVPEHLPVLRDGTAAAALRHGCLSGAAATTTATSPRSATSGAGSR